MKSIGSRTLKYPLLLVLASAILNTAIFPRIDQPWLAPVCLVPLFLLTASASPRRLFLYFWLAAFLFRLGNLYWIVHVIQHYSSLSIPVASGIVALLCATMALLWGITGACLGWIRNRKGFGAAMLLAPFLWIPFEWVLNLLQFPWCLAGYSLYRYLPLAQIATLTGVYGLTALIVAWNGAIAQFIVESRKYYLYSTIIITAVASGWGYLQISRPVGSGAFKVGVVQGNIPQDVKINYEFADEVQQIQLRVTRELIDEHHPDIVFWSESSTLYPLLMGGSWRRQVEDLAREMSTPILLGSDAYLGDEVYNSSFLINTSGEIMPLRYSKMYLVPFGEYVPFQKLLFFAGKVVPEISDFTPGREYTQFPLKEKSFAVNICFEVVFPQLARTFCRQGTGLLTTITNDAWFGYTCAPYQHFAMAVMRAIESRRYLVRAANTGISGIVDPYGRILQKTDIFVPAAISGEVRWVEEKTVYTRIGDSLVYVSLFVSAAFMMWAGRGYDRGPALRQSGSKAEPHDG